MVAIIFVALGALALTFIFRWASALVREGAFRQGSDVRFPGPILLVDRVSRQLLRHARDRFAGDDNDGVQAPSAGARRAHPGDDDRRPPAAGHPAGIHLHQRRAGGQRRARAADCGGHSRRVARCGRGVEASASRHSDRHGRGAARCRALHESRQHRLDPDRRNRAHADVMEARAGAGRKLLFRRAHHAGYRQLRAQPGTFSACWAWSRARRFPS